MRILIVQTSFLGDVILSTPVIAAVKALHPAAEIYLLTTPRARDLVRRDPLVKEVLVFDKRGNEAGIAGLLRAARKLRALRFDRVYSLHRSWRTALLLAAAGIPLRVGFTKAKLRFLYHHLERRDPSLHDVLRNLSLLAAEAPIDSLPQELRLFAPSDDEISEHVREFAERAPRLALLVPGSAWATKRWDAAHYRTVAERLIADGLTVACIGDPGERELCEEVARGTAAAVLAGRTTLAEAAWLISRAALVVCNDSMALHMASAFKTPTVAVFCATSPAFGFGPWKNRAAVVERDDLACKPCSRHGGPACPTGTWSCMRDLPPELVLRKARELLTTSGESASAL